MANRNAPTGLRPVFHLTGGACRTQRYRIASGYGVAIFSGDLVSLLSTDRTLEAGDAAADAPFIGVFWGCWYRDTGGNVIYSKYWPASTVTLGAETATAYVYDDPNIVYEIQSDGATAVTDVGQDADISYTVGDTATGVSKTELKHSDIGTGDNLHIYDIVEREDNTAAQSEVKLLVLINEHGLKTAGAVSYEEV